ncbi:MAG: GTPase Era [Gammaproteobacteria bacterium]|nr:GTPase Era [Gammaproteobacteria bacterium]
MPCHRARRTGNRPRAQQAQRGTGGGGGCAGTIDGRIRLIVVGIVQPAVGFRCGHAAVIGRPNVGKSTLVNQLVGQKLCITSRRPQTTRWAVPGIRTSDTSQIIYVDTPGIQPGVEHVLSRHMNREIDAGLAGADVVLLLVEALKWVPADQAALGAARSGSAPIVLVLNKTDRVKPKSRLLPFVAEVAGRAAFAGIVPVSARNGDGIPDLERLVLRLLPESPAAYPDDMLTDRNEKFLAAEFIREKLIRKLGAEVPYRLAVAVEKFSTVRDMSHIHATIWVESEGQKAIVIGAGGGILKAVGQEARRDLEQLFGRRINMKTWVRVKRRWSQDPRSMRVLGYFQ